MAIVQLGIERVSETVAKPVVIPSYQRPYKWDERLVMQLINDLLRHQDKSAYRLGTLVFHRPTDDAPLQVVDGQQRLITLSLLSHHLGCSLVPRILTNKVTHGLSQSNIRNNSAMIAQRLALLSEDQRLKLLRFVETKCEWVIIVLDDISEAFQFFDSQNARGKELEPYDLLKAYHLREMSGSSEEERIACVKVWEAHVEDRHLKDVMDEFLFRIRSWLQGRSGRLFRKADVDLFKGVRLEKDPDFPYLKSLRIQDHFTRQYVQDPVRSVDRQSAEYPFQIGQVMIDGQRFFEYVQHYIALRERLRVELPSQAPDVHQVLETYEGRKRDGDLYTRNLFDCVMLCYLDKFGAHGLKQAVSHAFAWTYEMRLTQQSVRLATMDNKALSPGNMFAAIQQAHRPVEVLSHRVVRLTGNEIKSTKTQAIQDHLMELGYLNHA